MKDIYTIGYSCFKIDDFVSVLKSYKISTLIDVRSNPNSKFYEDYNQKNLEKILAENGFIYRNYNKEFGARQENRKYYKKGYLDFSEYAKSDAFLDGISKIEAGIHSDFTFVFMCAEKDPSTCHRSIMVAREFFKLGYNIKNILADGSFETQEDLEQRMIKQYFPNRNQLSFFSDDRSLDEMIDLCYQYRNSEIGYRIDEDEFKVNIS